MVYRHPLMSTIAEFNGQRFDQVSGFTSVDSFLRAATSTNKGFTNLTELYFHQIWNAEQILSYIVVVENQP